MALRVMMYLNLFAVLITFSLSFSCGRIIEESEADSGKDGNGPRERESGPIVVPEDIIKSQRLICDDPLFCPESITKLVIKSKEGTFQCVGTLIDGDKVLTSASCLPKSLRIPSLACSKNVFAVFAAGRFAPEEIVACRDIEYVNGNLFTEPALWQSDIAIVNLSRKLDREVALLYQNGVGHKESLEAWKIENKTKDFGVIKKDLCQSLLGTYLNPFSTDKFSSMFVVNNCHLNVNSAGAPLYKDGKLAGIFSVEMGDRIYNYLTSSKILDGEIKRYFHVNNVGCFEDSHKYFGFGAPQECFVKKTVSLLDQGRSSILKSVEIHDQNMDAIKSELEAEKKYFSWNVYFQYSERLNSVEAHLGRPKCLYDVGSWIGQYRTWRGKIWTYANVELEVPNYRLSIKLNSDLRPISVVDESETKIYKIEFNPYDAYVNKNSFVTISSSLHGVETSVTYDGIDTDC